MAQLHFAFVACNRNASRFREDPSFIYRCENMAAAMEAAGHRVTLLHLKSLTPFSRFDVLVFHRPRWSPRLAVMLPLMRRRCGRVAADFDDLVFDESFAGFSPGVVNGLVSLDATRRTFRAARRAFPLFDLVTVSTAPLAEHARRLFPLSRVEVVPNAVHHSWRGNSALNQTAPERPVITYFPGTRSHDRDFATIAGALERFLEKHAEACLHVTGPLKLALSARPGQVVHREKVPFAEYHHHFRESWLNLAPLEETPFNRCKSALKVLEAGFWNIPTICSPTPDAARFKGAGAFLAEGEEDWFGQMEALLDPERYRAVTMGLRDRVLRVAQVEKVATRMVDFAGNAA